MFLKNKILFFVLQFIFCMFLVYFINQQIILLGIFDNFIVELITIYILILFISHLISRILTQIYGLLSKLIKHNINKPFVLWLLFTIVCYALTFLIFAVVIEY